MRASLLSSKIGLSPASSAAINPRLVPPAKPRLLLFSINAQSSGRWAMPPASVWRSAACEALSTTHMRGESVRHPATWSRHASVSAAAFQLRITTASVGGLSGGTGMEGMGINVDRYCYGKDLHSQIHFVRLYLHLENHPKGADQGLAFASQALCW